MSDTPERILRAAEAVLVRKGIDGARLRDIASTAGVNQALIHYYFGTKEELSRLVLHRVVRKSLVPVAHAWSAADPPQINVPRAVRACVTECRARPGVPGFVLTALHREPTLARVLLDGAGDDPDGAIPAGRAVIRRFAAHLRRHAPDGDGTTVSAIQLLTNLLALCLFPFVTRPALQVGLGMGDDGFDHFLDRHVDQVSTFILRGLDPASFPRSSQETWPTDM